jgi:hypothetical protein
MTIEQLIPVVFQISMGLIMFCVALRANLRNVGYLIERPGLLVRSLLAMNVIMPLFAVALALLFEFRPALEVAFVALALSPVPPSYRPGSSRRAARRGTSSGCSPSRRSSRSSSCPPPWDCSVGCCRALSMSRPVPSRGS